MSDPQPPQPHPDPPGPLDLLLPDWGGLDTVRRSPLPFALWMVGDQCLLHHWFDHAVNEGHTEVRVHTADRPAEVRALVGESTLWPLRVSVHALDASSRAPAEAQVADHLPGCPSPPAPRDGWELLDRVAALEEQWLERLHADPMGPLLAIGSLCRIHPEAEIIEPTFIGDHVLIGPGCRIGPHAVIGHGSLIAGASEIRHSQLAPHSYLGPVTELDGCLVEGGVLYHRRHRARLDRVERHLLSDLSENAPPVPWRDRLLALRLFSRLSTLGREEGSFSTFDGRVLPGSAKCTLADRRARLPLVWRGELALFGVLPRSKAQLEALDPEWRNVLQHAPIGVFSWADLHGHHSPDDPEEALHAVYQSSVPAATLRADLLAWLRELQADSFSHAAPTS